MQMMAVVMSVLPWVVVSIRSTKSAQRVLPRSRSHLRSAPELVTFTSISRPSITSSPTRNRPRSSRPGRSRSQISRSRSSTSTIRAGIPIRKSPFSTGNRNTAATGSPPWTNSRLLPSRTRSSHGWTTTWRCPPRVESSMIEAALGSVVTQPQHAVPAESVDRLDDALLVLADEVGDQVGRGGHQGGRAQVGVLERPQLLVGDPHAARVVDQQRARGVDAVEHQRGIEIGAVHGRIGPQEYGVRLGELGPAGVAAADVVRPGDCRAVDDREVGGSARPHVVSAGQGGAHDAERRVDGRVEPVERVADDDDVQRRVGADGGHRRPPTRRAMPTISSAGNSAIGAIGSRSPRSPG